MTKKLINGVIPDASARKMFDKYDKEEFKIKSELITIRTSNDDSEELPEFGLDKLASLKQNARRY